MGSSQVDVDPQLLWTLRLCHTGDRLGWDERSCFGASGRLGVKIWHYIFHLLEEYLAEISQIRPDIIITLTIKMIMRSLSPCILGTSVEWHTEHQAIHRVNIAEWGLCPAKGQTLFTCWDDATAGTEPTPPILCVFWMLSALKSVEERCLQAFLIH